MIIDKSTILANRTWGKKDYHLCNNVSCSNLARPIDKPRIKQHNRNTFGCSLHCNLVSSNLRFLILRAEKFLVMGLQLQFESNLAF